MALAVASNSHEALLRRLDAGTLTWRGPALMLFTRSAFGVGAQALVAAVFVLRSSPTPWHDAEPWLPVYGTLIDAGCLALLWGAHAPRGHRPVRSCRLRAGTPRPRCAAGLCAHPCEPRIHLRWHLCGRLARVRDTHATVPLRRLAIAGCSLWRDGVPV